MRAERGLRGIHRPLARSRREPSPKIIEPPPPHLAYSYAAEPDCRSRGSGGPCHERRGVERDSPRSWRLAGLQLSRACTHQERPRPSTSRPRRSPPRALLQKPLRPVLPSPPDIDPTACPSPKPPPLARVDVGLLIVGASRLILDSTPIVGPDPDYCEAIGFTDRRRFCPPRPEGHPDRRRVRRAPRGARGWIRTGTGPRGRRTRRTAWRARFGRPSAETTRRTSSSSSLTEPACTKRAADPGCAAGSASSDRGRPHAPGQAYC